MAQTGGRRPRVLVLHGPNLNLLGRREPEIYGTVQLEAIDAVLTALAAQVGGAIECRQSNYEGQLIDWVQEAVHDFDGILFNPAGYGHTSVALRDAISAAKVPCVEVHLTNIHARESFRHETITAPVCLGVVVGFGPQSYALGLRALMDYLKSPDHESTHTT